MTKINETKNNPQQILFIDEIPLIHKNDEEMMKIFQQHQQTCPWHDFSFSPDYSSPNFGSSQCRINLNNHENNNLLIRLKN